MLNVIALPLGAYQTNTYIVHAKGAKSCAIIDPGYDAKVILSKVAALGLTVDAVLLTHGHFDHVGAVEELVTQTGCKLWMHQGDWAQRNDPTISYFYPLANCDFTEVQFCEEGKEICTAGLKLTVLETPGHTHGSVCYLCENALFSGDTLFAGSCGRTDLPGGDWNIIQSSLSRLAGLKDDLTVYPGHGNSTTLAEEKLYNPYMQ